MARELRLFGHPVHSMLIHFPMALLGTSLFWDGVAWLTSAEWGWRVSFWNIALGLAAALAAAVPGFVDYAAVAEKHAAATSKATTHMTLMLSAVCCYGASLAIRGGAGAPSGWHLPAAVAAEGAGLLLLLSGAWFGGELAFRHGVGRAQD